MRRDILLLEEVIGAAEQAHRLVMDVDLSALESDRLRRDALLWNFTVLGEAIAQLDANLKGRHPDIPWTQPVRLRNRIVHGYWSIDMEILHATACDLLPAFTDQVRGVLAELAETSGDHEAPGGAAGV